jgi:beta-lactamase regulating signal transducer with metallopeptidase domain
MEANQLQQFISTGPAEMLIASIWQGLLLTALAWAALKLAPGLRASTRFTLWMIVFTLVALLPCFALGRAFFGDHSFFTSTAPQATYSLRLNSAWAFVIEGLWVLASLLSLARLFVSMMQTRTLWRTSTPVHFHELDAELQSIVVRAGSRPVEVRLSDAVDAPSVLGFFRPAVIVPRSLWSELAPSELKQIILHEIAHLDRGDDWTNLLQKLLRALCPLNPALFWAERHLSLEREQACDDAVLDAAGNARAYATCLTKLAENRLVKRAALLAPGFWKKHSELAGRVENILHRRRNLAPMLSRGLVAAGLAVSLSGVLLLQRFPGIITFAGNDSVAAAATAMEPVYPQQHQQQHQARYQEAVFHPEMSRQAERASVLPKPHSIRPVKTSRRLQFVQVTEDQDGGVITLVLFTVEVPQSTRVSHGEPRTTLPSPDHWIAFQI